MHKLWAQRADEMLRIIVRGEADKRISEKHFRGTSVAKAGNFFRWPSLAKMLADSHFRRQMTEEFWESYDDGAYGTNSFEMSYGSLVGWESTDALSNYSESALEKFNPNKRSSALRVRTERVDLLAPLTDLVTVVYELRDENMGPVAVIHSLYPGNDVGPLNNDVTIREKRVFFDWDHPGVLSLT